MKAKNFVIYLSIMELANLLTVPVETIEKLIRAGIHPAWHWLPSMKAPRFHPDTIPEWLRILDTVDLATLPDDLPPLKHPGEVFEGREEKPAGPTAHELTLAAKILGVKGPKKGHRSEALV